MPIDSETLSLLPNAAMAAPPCDPFTINRMSCIDLGTGFLHDMFSHIDLFYLQITLAQNHNHKAYQKAMFSSVAVDLRLYFLHGVMFDYAKLIPLMSTPVSHDSTVPRSCHYML